MVARESWKLGGKGAMNRKVESVGPFEHLDKSIHEDALARVEQMWKLESTAAGGSMRSILWIRNVLVEQISNPFTTFSLFMPPLAFFLLFQSFLMNLIFEIGGFFKLRSLQVQEIERGKEILNDKRKS